MIRTFGMVSVAVAALVVAGCDQAKSKSSTAATSTAATPPAKVDSNVTQTAATIETPQEKPADKPADKTVEIGVKGPAWENLAGTDGKQHSLKDLKDSKAVAVVFTCNTCPVAIAYEARLAKLTDDYRDKGVTIVAINVNKDPRNDLDAMKLNAEKNGFPFAYLFDPSQQIARDYGATCTPHVFLLDGERKIAYMGAIDDNMNADAVKEHHLKDAIDAVLAGKAPAVATTEQVGCGIAYE